MKTLLTAVVMVVSGTNAVAQQIDDILIQPGGLQTINWEAPFNYEVVGNDWKRGGRQYSDEAVIAAVSQVLYEEWGAIPGLSTRRMLGEIRDAEALRRTGWTKDSIRLTPGYKEVAETLVRITVGGSNSGSTRVRAQGSVGNVRVGGSGEHGSAEAFIKIEVINLNTTKGAASIAGRAKYASGNLESVGASSGFGRPRFNFEQRRSRPADDRGHVVVERAFATFVSNVRQAKNQIR